MSIQNYSNFDKNSSFPESPLSIDKISNKLKKYQEKFKEINSSYSSLSNKIKSLKSIEAKLLKTSNLLSNSNDSSLQKEKILADVKELSNQIEEKEALIWIEEAKISPRIDKKEQIEIYKYSSKYFNQSAYDNTKFIENFAKIPQNQRASVDEYLSKLSTFLGDEDLSNFEILQSMKLIADFPSSYRGNICKFALRLFELPNCDQRSLLSALEKVSRRYAFNVNDLKSEFFNKKGYESDTIQQIEDFGKLLSSIENAPSFCQIVANFMNEKMVNDQRYAIASKIATIPSKERASVCEIVAKLITKENEIEPRPLATIIDNILMIPNDSRDEIYNLASTKLFSDDMSATNRAAIMKDLAKVPLKQRADFCDFLIKHFFKDQTHSQDKTQIINHLSEIPNLAEFYEISKIVFPKEMTPYNKALLMVRLFQRTATIPLEQLKPMTEFAEKILPKENVSINTIIRTILSSSIIPKDEQQSFIELFPEYFSMEAWINNPLLDPIIVFYLLPKELKETINVFIKKETSNLFKERAIFEGIQTSINEKFENNSIDYGPQKIMLISNITYIYENYQEFDLCVKWYGKYRDEHVSKIPQTWLTSLLEDLRTQNISYEEMRFLITDGFLKSVYQLYKDPLSKKNDINTLLVEFIKNKDLIKDISKDKLQNHTKFPIVLLAVLHAKGVELKTCQDLLKLVSNNFFKSGKNLRIFVNAVFNILSENKLSITDKEFLLSKFKLPIKKLDSGDDILELLDHKVSQDLKNLSLIKEKVAQINDNKKLSSTEKSIQLSKIKKENQLDKISVKLNDINFKDLILLIQSIEAFKSMDEMGVFSKAKLEKTSSINQLLQDAMINFIPMKKIDDFNEKFSKYFITERIPNFLFTYAAKLKSEIFEKERLLSFLGTIVESILKEEYPASRYNIEGKHLNTVFTGRDTLLNEWKKGDKAPLGSFLVETDSDLKSVNFIDLLKEKIITDHHLQKNDIPLLFEYLDQGIDQQIDGTDPLSSLQKNCIALTKKELSLNDQKLLLKEIDKSLKELGTEFDEFKNDIKSFFTGLTKQHETKESYDRFTIEDTDNYLDLWLCGQEVEGSCQRIDGSGSLNKCLMSYIADGKNRLLAIKDQNGKIVARQIFRILWDGEKPVLFLERIYPSLVNPKFKAALETFANQRAVQLGNLPLLSQEAGDNRPLYKAIQSLGTPAPYEYSDAGGGTTQGVYTISNAYVMK